MQNLNSSAQLEALAPASMISLSLHRMKPVAIVTLALLMLCGTTHAQTQVKQVKLTSGDVVAPSGLDQISKPIALHGNRLSLARSMADKPARFTSMDTARAVPSRAHSGLVRWGRLATLVAPSGSAGERFGFSVAVGGNTIVVGAPPARETVIYPWLGLHLSAQRSRSRGRLVARRAAHGA